VFDIRFYPRNDRVALTSLQFNHVESICNYLSRGSVRARATGKWKNDNKNKYRGPGGGGQEGEGLGEYHAMKCQRIVPNENPPPFFCPSSVLRNKEEINTNERALSSRQLQIYFVYLREMK
jgi:hypothetical protein